MWKLVCMAEKWPIILKNCSMLGDTYNAQKNASIIYLGLIARLNRVKKVRMRPAERCVKVDLHERSGSQAS